MSTTADKVRESQTVQLEIDGQTLTARRGQMVIEAADEAGIVIPRFCYHKKLSIAANCRMCLVEVEKVPKPLPACATPVTEGMKVFTRSPRAIEAQQGTMEFLLINHPLDCPICDQGGECDLQEISIGFGNDHSRYHENKRVVPDKNIGPLISTEMTRCIHCTRCVRFGDEIAGVRELGATGRGENMRIGTYIEQAVASELSGNVIDICPVGALTSKPFRFTARAWEMTKRPGIAPHDCVGSNLSILLRNHRVMRVDPAENEQINECWIADRDRYSYEALNSPQRMNDPMVRRNGQWEKTDWMTALQFTVDNLKQVIDQHGAGALGALISPSNTIEEMYLLQKLMRALGSHNVDHRLRQQDFTDQDLEPLFPWLGQDIESLEKVDCALLIGSNLRKDQPMLNHRLRKAVLNGARVVSVSHADYDFNYDLQDRMIAPPSAMVENLKGIASAVVARSGYPVSNELSQSLSRVSSTADQERIAETLLAARNGTVIVGTQALIHPDYALLRALAGTIAEACKMKLGLLSFGANSAGAMLSGAVPHRLCGAQALAEQGLNALDMMKKNLHGYVLVNVEPEYDCADAGSALNTLLDANFVVSLSPFTSPYMEKYADVILPIAAYTETAGTYVNCAGTWQSFTGVAVPPGEARPAWKVLRVLGNLLDLDGFDYTSAEEVRDECRARIGEAMPDNTKAWRWREPSASPSATVRLADVPIYAVDNLLRRADALQQTQDAEVHAVFINQREAAALNLNHGDSVQASQHGEGARFPVVIDDRIPDGCAFIPAGIPGSEVLGLHGTIMTLTAQN